MIRSRFPYNQQIIFIFIFIFIPTRIHYHLTIISIITPEYPLVTIDENCVMAHESRSILVAFDSVNLSM